MSNTAAPSRPLSPQSIFPLALHKKLIFVTLSCYLAATISSMAGMEIFGWTTILLNLAYIARNPKDPEFSAGDLAQFIPWKSGLLLIAIVVIGLLVNSNAEADLVYDIGSLRWNFLFWGLAYGFSLWPPTTRWYRNFAIFIGLVAIYAYFQSLTGIDLLRPGSHRAVQPLDFDTKFTLWRSAGLFGSPLQYAYIAGQHVCLPLALTLLLAEHRKRFPRLFWGSFACYTLVSLSILTTFTRGAWLSMAIAQLSIAALVSAKMARRIAGAGAIVVLVMFLTLEPFRVRVQSLFNPSYASNSERVFLWKANFEMFKDYPVFGIGYLENETRAKEYVTRLGKPNAFTGHAHNNYIQMLSGTGVSGFATYMFIIGFMLWLTLRLWQKLPKDLIWPRALCLAALGAQIHIHVGGFTECNFKAGATNHNLMVFWALVAAMTLLENKGLLRSSRFDCVKAD